MIAHTLNMCAPYILCTFDNIFGIVELRHYYVYTTFGMLTLFVCNLQFKLIPFLYIKTFHNDCSPIEHVPTTQVHSRVWSCLLVPYNIAPNYVDCDIFFRKTV